ncbi:protein kinase [Achlya hypogyna]|uniref:Protein kinase n=1 Tax=Achlya hypogyna TaxID=1202772 RepID=A0A1V9ZF19_ACHHY|nr:protein kinase [Achlya hypogyna]
MLQSAFFNCQAAKAACASPDVAQFLQRCGQFDRIGYDETAGSACCYAADAAAVRQCLYFRTERSPLEAYRINLFYDPSQGSAKPKVSLANWHQYQHITWVDIAGVSVDPISPSTFTYTSMQKLSVIDADLMAIETPPIASLNVIDLHGNALTSFPSYLFGSNYATIQQLDVTGNNFASTVAVDASTCSKLSAAVGSQHVTGPAITCSCGGQSATCSVGPPQTTAAPTTTAPPTTSPVQARSMPPPTSAAAPQTTPSPPSLRASASPAPSTAATAKAGDSDGKSDSGTILISTMIVVCVVLAALALFLYRRRKRMHAALVMTGSRTLSSPQGTSFTRPLLLTGAPRSLKHIDSLSSHLSAERELKASVRSRMPITHHVDKIPILQPGDCRITHPIGNAIFAGQYRGEAIVLRRVDARIVSEEDVAGFVSDVNVLAPLVHPQLVALHGIVRLGDYEVGAVAEFMHCGSLPHILLNPEVELTWPDQLRMCFQVASGLAYVHSQAEFTRTATLTSRSVLVNNQLTCKLNIFEYMRHFQQHEGVYRTFGDGTIAWEAPEVLLHDCPRGGTADVYSLGVVLGEIVSRTRPYQRLIDAKGYVATDVAILDRDVRSTELPFSEDPEFESCPKAFRALVHSCLQRDVLKRPLAVAVAEELRRELLALQKNFG